MARNTVLKRTCQTGIEMSGGGCYPRHAYARPRRSVRLRPFHRQRLNCGRSRCGAAPLRVGRSRPQRSGSCSRYAPKMRTPPLAHGMRRYWPRSTGWGSGAKRLHARTKHEGRQAPVERLHRALPPHAPRKASEDQGHDALRRLARPGSRRHPRHGKRPPERRSTLLHRSCIHYSVAINGLATEFVTHQADHPIRSPTHDIKCCW